uniref:hypothetical protein n=1 Tax=Roseivirga sp. TaxID=1964215 RepID=UPI004047086F
MQNNNLKPENPTDANNVLASGFRSVREQNRFAKLISIVTIYQQDPDWEDGVKGAVKINCQKEADRLKFPYGWQSIGSYEVLKRWFFETCR